MTKKLEAAYHEAGHVTVAWVSPYHNVMAGIDLYSYGAGAAVVSVSKSKCKAVGKVEDETIKRDKDVAKASATIFMAGYQAELIAAETNSALRPNLTCADPDYKLTAQCLADAALSKKTDKAEQAANAILRSNWNVVEKIAQAVFEKGSLSVNELHELLNPCEPGPDENATSSTL
ncbi:hypothetical protein B7W89_24720 [Agrobacterium tumefaciens]|uniref:hypothetical protein n=1 Tax=Agrobacterium tumefaciens TaxID=358 RepID=UPI000B401AAA|nr:hypothetical protein [Agrobacterium tumefaciens]NSY04456.1 hypothetical protein [Agrobacterium tumefaciens]OVE86819.1 hypothetical protein B7W89_24720 [Agrobacterium tumefaciens]